MFTRFFILVTFLSAGNLLSAQILRGHVADNDSNERLAYASVGIKKKNSGGIADRNGAFSIDLSNIHSADSIVFSHIGYETAIFAVGNLDASKDFEVRLRRAAHELTDFVITAKVDILTLGNTKHSGRFTGWGDYTSSRGRARGIQIEPKEFPFKVTEFVCRIKHNSFDSVKIRINMFKKTAEGSGFEQLLQHNIYYTIRKNARTINVDLSPYNIIVKDTIILAIEWIDSWSGGKNTADENELFTISLGRKKGFCYERNTPNEEPLFKACDEMPAMYLKGYRAKSLRNE